MVAALPHVDHFLAGNSLRSLEELAELLGGLGLIVDTARSTVEAINKLRSQPAQVVVAYHLSASFDGVGGCQSVRISTCAGSSRYSVPATGR